MRKSCNKEPKDFQTEGFWNGYKWNNGRYG